MIGLVAILLLSVFTRNALLFSYAQMLPTTPGPNETYAAGSNCTIAWNVDPSGAWTNVSIDLMSGPNNNMTFVSNVVQDLDGTNQSLTPWTWTCPEVEPYSSIYFYQFTNNGNSSQEAWTTRFAITSPSGESEAPEYDEQPNGDPVPWGIGHLQDALSGAVANVQSPLTLTFTPALAAPSTTTLPLTPPLPIVSLSAPPHSRHGKHSTAQDDGTSPTGADDAGTATQRGGGAHASASASLADDGGVAQLPMGDAAAPGAGSAATPQAQTPSAAGAPCRCNAMENFAAAVALPASLPIFAGLAAIAITVFV